MLPTGRRHVFRTENRPAKLPQALDALLHAVERAVVVKGDHVAVFQGEAVERREPREVGPVIAPDADRERLIGRGGSCPPDDLWNQRQDVLCFLFGGEVPFSVGRGVVVVGLVHEVPELNAGVVGEMPNHSRDIVFQFVVPGGVAENFNAGRLDPAGVVNVRNGVVLLAELREGVPATVEEDEHRPDVVLLGDVEELIEALKICVRNPAARGGDAGKRERW